MKRDQTVYTCDGCRTSKAYQRGEKPTGWHTIITAPVGENLTDDKERHLCRDCFAGIDWIVRFQGVTIPPKVIANPAPLRTNARLPLTGPPPTPTPTHVTVDVVDTGLGRQIPGARHVHNHGTEEGPGLACRETLDATGQLIGACLNENGLTP